MKSLYNSIAIIGPTASGKTRVAAHIAYEMQGEVISLDSRQVYRGMDIGTGKDYSDYRVQGVEIPYHLIDIKKTGEKYNLFEFQNDFFSVFENILKRNRLPVLCGGSGLYIEGVMSHYKLVRVPVNPELRDRLKDKDMEELTRILSAYKKLHNKSDTDTKKRAIRAIEIAEYQSQYPEENISFPEIRPLIVGVAFDRPTQRKRITERLEQRLQEGMVEEVKGLLDQGVAAENLIYYGLEYKYLTWYLLDKLTYDEMKDRLNTAIHQFAKRQMTWFRRMERKGYRIHWIDGRPPLNQKVEQIKRWFYQRE